MIIHSVSSYENSMQRKASYTTYIWEIILLEIIKVVIVLCQSLGYGKSVQNFYVYHLNFRGSSYTIGLDMRGPFK